LGYGGGLIKPIIIVDPNGLRHVEIGGGFSFTAPGYHLNVSLSTESCCDKKSKKHIRTIQYICSGFSLGAAISNGSGPGASSISIVRSNKKCEGKLGESIDFYSGIGFSSALFAGASWSSSEPTTTTFITGLGISIQFWSDCKKIIKQDSIMGDCCNGG
jgi:hypothetical protein